MKASVRFRHAFKSVSFNKMTHFVIKSGLAGSIIIDLKYSLLGKDSGYVHCMCMGVLLGLIASHSFECFWLTGSALIFSMSVSSNSLTRWSSYWNKKTALSRGHSHNYLMFTISSQFYLKHIVRKFKFDS